MRSRRRSIRRKIFLLVIIPLLSLIGIYAFAASTTAGDAIALASATQVTNALREPNTNVQRELNVESMLALSYLTRPGNSSLAALDHQEAATNQALSAFKATVRSKVVIRHASIKEKRAIASLLSSLTRLSSVRAAVASGFITGPATLTYYSGLVTTGFRIYDGWIEQASSVPLVTQGLDLTKLGEAEQATLEESDLLTSALTAGSFPAADRAEFTELAGGRRALVAQALPDLGPPYRGYYDKFVSARSAAAVTALENAVIGGPEVHGLPAIQPTAGTVAEGYVLGLAAALAKSGDVIAAQAQAQADATYRRLILIGGLGLLAIIVSTGISVIIGRRIVGQLAELRQSALEIANHRLPDVIRRLRAGEQVDNAAEALTLSPASDEIGQVSQAFDLVQRAAIEAATGEARLRSGVSDVFRNLARRSQTLLHRQLTLLDAMERKASQPEELEDLFRVDHLTTRMRRHAENLIILSGALPGRGWRHPVPMVDVLRAAAAEVEDYSRIRMMARTSASLAGPAVADVIHLIAELAENATVFSPPHTRVRIEGEVVGRGFAIEIEDRGVGMPQDRLDDANRDLADPPEFDLSNSDQMGLLIAGKLAQRHDIEITLRRSPFGGIAAIVLIPPQLILDEDVAELDHAIAAESEQVAPPSDRYDALSGDPEGMPSAANGHPAAAHAAETAGPPYRLSSSGLADETSPDWMAAPPQATAGQPSATRSGQVTRGAPPWPILGSTSAEPASRAPADLDRPQPAVHLDAMGLPVRVQQASLAPQLRAPAESGRPAEGAATRPALPEAAANTMAAMQRGWELGRSVSDDDPPDQRR